VRKLTKKEAWSKLGLWIQTTNQSHDIWHGFQLRCRSNDRARAPSVTSNFSKNMREPRAKRLTFRLTNNSPECKIYEITGQTVIYSFRSITRNITRLIFPSISRWFIMVFYEPGFLLIRRSLVRAQVEEPSATRMDAIKLAYQLLLTSQHFHAFV
jgi:hypothetical protein